MIDDCVGRILDTLEVRGLAEDTIVVFTSDHGELLGDHGLIRKGPMPCRQLLQIPLLMKGPDIPEGETIDALTSHLDIKDTLLELMGFSGGSTDGTSLIPLLDDSVSAVRDRAFAEYYPRSVQNQYNQTVITDDTRLTIYPLAEDLGWGELFDHSIDPGEHNNLFHAGGNRNQITAMKQLLKTAFPAKPDTLGRVLVFY